MAVGVMTMEEAAAVQAVKARVAAATGTEAAAMAVAVMAMEEAATV